MCRPNVGRYHSTTFWIFFFNETGGVCTPTSVLLNCKKVQVTKGRQAKLKVRAQETKKEKKIMRARTERDQATVDHLSID
jgi:hypothetical protein